MNSGSQSKYTEVLEKVVEFCEETPEVVYTTKEFIELLGLDVNSGGFGISLSSNHEKFRLLKIHDNHLKPHYGISKICGSRECFESWCGSNLCERGGKNPELKFYSRVSREEIESLKERTRRGIESSAEFLKFSDLQKLTKAKEGIDPLGALVREVGVTYVIAATREDCKGCEEQKPHFKRLAYGMKGKHPEKVEFFIVHSSYSEENKEEAEQAMDTFNTVGFPTFLINVKTDKGKNRETYRSVGSTPMDEIERNIEKTIKSADWFKSKLS